ncbi:MAG: hypothetical protein IJP68_09920, partial [Selenomonadaceae bacterium]|nr:hypothetical protein [Selenomonadaceae bacterium]
MRPRRGLFLITASNRAPTLHRLGIQAFEPVLTEGRALKLHPLACTAYNADFDGDQMAIHLPLSAEAQAEARVLMLAANHILAPKDGKPIIVPTQDMVLGTYYLTKIRRGAAGTGNKYSSPEEAMMAHEAGKLHLQAEIYVRLGERTVKTTLGRILFNEKLPEQLRQFHADGTLGTVMNKKELGKLVAQCFNAFGATVTAEVIDEVKRLGYHYACIAGMTVAISDVITPPAKAEILQETAERVKRVETYYNRGVLTEEERYKKVIALWEEATNRVADAMMANLDEFNPIFMMADSGARGNKQQMRQLAGMRGLMADPSGKTIDLPITANFREGLSVSDYFISSHGARKGLADTALRTADSGYLTRRLVDVAQDVIVREHDCDELTINLTLIRAKLATDTFDALELLNEALLGRVIAVDVLNSAGEVVIAHDTILDDAALETLGELDTPEITLRGQSLTAPNAASHSLVSETIKLGTRDELERQKIRESFINEFIGKELVNGEILTHDSLESILDNEELPSITIRRGLIRGIEVEAITEETRANDGRGVIESLEDRILGRVLAEDIYDSRLIAKSGTVIDAALAEKISDCRNVVKLVDGEESLANHIIGRTLDEDISTGTVIDVALAKKITSDENISAGTLIDAHLAEKICACRNVVKLSDGEESLAKYLIGRTLDEDISELNLTTGTVIDARLAKKISAVRNVVKLSGGEESLANHIIGRTLAEDISELNLTAGTLIDAHLAEKI